MATAIAVGDIMSARAWMQLDEQAAVNTYNYSAISKTGGGGTDQDLAGALDAIFAAFYVPLTVPTVEYRGCQVYFLRRPAGGVLPAPVKSTSGAAVGSASGSPVPRNTAPIMKYSSLMRGPGGRGRVFLPFAAQGYVATNGRPTNSFDVLVNSFASALLAPITVGSGGNTTTLTWELIRRVTGSPPVTTGQILSAEAANKFGQMHKRGDYGRANASPI